MSKAEVTYEELLDILKQDFTEKTANEILVMIDRLGKRGMDIDKVEEEVTQLVVNNFQRDFNKVIQSLSGPPIQLPKIPNMGFPDAQKDKK